MVIKAPKNQVYQHIKFPKPNILIKRGTVTGYKDVKGNTVIIESVSTDDDGSYNVVLAKKDGTKFFGFLSKVNANYTKALAANEIESIP